MIRAGRLEKNGLVFSLGITGRPRDITEQRLLAHRAAAAHRIVRQNQPAACPHVFGQQHPPEARAIHRDQSPVRPNNDITFTKRRGGKVPQRLSFDSINIRQPREYAFLPHAAVDADAQFLAQRP